jgi:putative membrane protein
MTIRWVLAALHLLGLGIGLGAVWARARALSGPLDPPALRRAFAADAWWGAAAVVWISTGLWRVLAGMEKSTQYYMQSNAFWVKMALLGLILALEILPAVTLTRWRSQVAKGQTPDTRRASTLATLSLVQALVVIAMVFAATAMARGMWM